MKISLNDFAVVAVVSLSTTRLDYVHVRLFIHMPSQDR